MFNVLIVSGGSFQGSTLIKGLYCSPRVRIHLADCYPDNINKYECDKFHEVPLVFHSEIFIKRIKQIVIEENIQVVFPSTDIEIGVLSKYKKSIESRGTKVAVSDFSLNGILTNKIKTYRFLKANGFSLLDLIDPQNQKVPYPIIGKPIHGSGSKGIVIVRNENDHKRTFKSISIKDYLWIPFIEDFEEFSIDFAISFKREISPIIIRKRIRTAGGFAVITESEDNEHIRQQIAHLAEIFKNKGGCGIFNVQVIKYNDNSYHFSDINPRVGTSSVFAFEAGVNLPLLMCAFLWDDTGAHKISHDVHGKFKMVRNLSEKWLKIMPKGKIKGVVFDLDDTLIDQKTWVFDKLSIMHAKHAHQLPEKEAFIVSAYQLIEEGMCSTLIDELNRKFRLPESLRDELIQSFRSAQPECIRVFRDVADNLAKLKRLGFKLGLLTDNPVRSQKQKIGMLEFIHLFDAILFSRDYNREKPDKFLFDKTAAKLSVDKDQLVMVGDNLYRDCYGALKAGYQVAYFIKRRGAFFNFNHEYFVKNIKLPHEKIIKIASLNDLYYSIENGVL